MRVIALMNQKGGVGKTTTAVNLGAALAEMGKRVCMIDMDPQAHLTINFGLDPRPGNCSLYDVLVEEKSFLEAVQEVGTNIAIVPSSIDLAGAEVELVSVVGREMILKTKLESAQHDFDYLLIDCPPSLGLLTVNALAVASEVIIPMQPHFLALQGVAKLLETVQLVNRRMNPRLKVAGIVLTMFDAQTKLTGEVVAELERFISEANGKPLPWAGAKIYQSRIRRNIKLAESPSFGQTILQYDPASHGAADYRALAREVAGVAETVIVDTKIASEMPAVASVSKPAQPQRVEVAVKPVDRPAAVKAETKAVAPAPLPATREVKPVVAVPSKVEVKVPALKVERKPPVTNAAPPRPPAAHVVATTPAPVKSDAPKAPVVAVAPRGEPKPTAPKTELKAAAGNAEAGSVPAKVHTRPPGTVVRNENKSSPNAGAASSVSKPASVKVEVKKPAAHPEPSGVKGAGPDSKSAVTQGTEAAA